MGIFDFFGEAFGRKEEKRFYFYRANKLVEFFEGRRRAEILILAKRLPERRKKQKEIVAAIVIGEKTADGADLRVVFKQAAAQGDEGAAKAAQEAAETISEALK